MWALRYMSEMSMVHRENCFIWKQRQNFIGMLFCLVETSQKHECLVRCAAHQATRLPEVGRWKLPSGLGTKPSGAWHSRRTCPLLLLDLKQVYFKLKSKCLNVQMCSIQPTEFKFQCPLNYLQIELKGCAKYGRERKKLCSPQKKF